MAGPVIDPLTGGTGAPDDVAAAHQAAQATIDQAAGDIVIAGSVTVGGWLTDEPPIVSGGYGGFQPHPRPLKTALTQWEGRDPFQLTVPLLLDVGGDAVSPAIRALDQLAVHDKNTPAETVKVTGAIHIPEQAGEDWVINDLAWGAVLRRASDTVIIRQHVTVTLLEHITDTLLAASTLSARHGNRIRIRHYRVHKGDTLQSIAARQLGDPKRWADIAALNGLRSSGQLRPGRLIRLP
jgi:nucleoid-associated protein YgaU